MPHYTPNIQKPGSMEHTCQDNLPVFFLSIGFGSLEAECQDNLSVLPPEPGMDAMEYECHDFSVLPPDLGLNLMESSIPFNGEQNTWLLLFSPQISTTPQKRPSFFIFNALIHLLSMVSTIRTFLISYTLAIVRPYRLPY